VKIAKIHFHSIARQKENLALQYARAAEARLVGVPSIQSQLRASDPPLKQVEKKRLPTPATKFGNCCTGNWASTRAMGRILTNMRTKMTRGAVCRICYMKCQWGLETAALQAFRQQPRNWIHDWVKGQWLKAAYACNGLCTAYNIEHRLHFNACKTIYCKFVRNASFICMCKLSRKHQDNGTHYYRCINLSLRG